MLATSQSDEGQILDTSNPDQGQILVPSLTDKGQMFATSPSDERQILASSHPDQGQILVTSQTDEGQMLATNQSDEGLILATSHPDQGQILVTSRTDEGEMLATSPSDKGEMLATSPSDDGQMYANSQSDEGQIQTTNQSDEGQVLTASQSGEGQMLAASLSDEGQMLTTSPSGDGQMLAASPSDEGQMLAASCSDEGEMSAHDQTREEQMPVPCPSDERQTSPTCESEERRISIPSHSPVILTSIFNQSEEGKVTKEDHFFAGQMATAAQAVERQVVSDLDSGHLSVASISVVGQPSPHLPPVEIDAEEIVMDQSDPYHLDETPPTDHSSSSLRSRLQSPFLPSPVTSCTLSPSPTRLPSGLSWSPDGRHLAVSATDACIRVYLPTNSDMVAPKLVIKETEHIYSFCWAPTRSPMLAATGRYQPVHLWDLSHSTARLAGTYKCINQLDELSHAFSTSFSLTGDLLYCGMKGEVRVFAVSRPGRECTTRLTSKSGQGGILSCIAHNPTLPVYAVGCYNRTTGLYSSKEGSLLCLLTGQVGGVTQVTFSLDGTRLFTGGRKDGEILAWDLRQPGRVLFSLRREVTTNQRVEFCLSPCGRYLVSANTDGSVRVWDLEEGQVEPETGVLGPLQGWLLHGDAVSGVSWQPGGDWLATCSGQRHFWAADMADSGGEDEEPIRESTVKIWSLGVHT